MKITPYANSQYLDYCSVNNVQNRQPYFCAKKSKDEFVSDTKANESFSERFIKKFLPGKAAELNLLKLIKLRNKNCPDDTLDERFAHEKLSLVQREQLQHLIYIPNRQKQLTKSELLKLVDNSYSYYRNERIYKKKDCTDNIIKYNLLYDIKNRREQFELDEIMKLGYEQPKTIEKILSLGLLENIKGRKVQPDMDDIITFAKALPDDNKEAQKVLKTIANRNLLTTDFGKGECLSLDKALVLAELDKKTYKEFLQKGLLKYHTNFSSDVLKRMLLYDFDDKQVSRFKKILQRDVFLYETYANKVMALSDKQTELFLKVIDAGFQHKDSLAAFHVTTLDDDILEKFEKARSDAKLKKNLLKDGEHDLADEDIDDFFAENWDLICITIDTIGLPAFEYAYATKLEGLENLVRLNKVKFGGISDTFQSKLKKLLADKTISPDERLDKFRIMASLPDSGRSWLYPFIVPHRVTPENLSDAKAIWAQRGKTFDEKYLEFCEKFHISPDDTKIRK